MPHAMCRTITGDADTPEGTHRSRAYAVPAWAGTACARSVATSTGRRGPERLERVCGDAGQWSDMPRSMA